eukprot:g81239.t1
MKLKISKRIEIVCFETIMTLQKQACPPTFLNDIDRNANTGAWSKLCRTTNCFWSHFECHFLQVVPRHRYGRIYRFWFARPHAKLFTLADNRKLFPLQNNLPI